MIIRGAKPEDAQNVAELITMAWEELACIFAGSKNKNEVKSVISTFCKEKDNRFSYEYIDVIETEKNIAGLVLAFPADYERKLNKPIIKKLPSMYKSQLGEFKKRVMPMLKNDEGQPGEYYIDSIAVRPEYRNKGIGKKLLKLTQKKAERKGFEKISLLVKPKNKKAIKLYKNYGYNEDGFVGMPTTDYIRMVNS